ncbi:WG repeat-containing protein [bacterium]|nr:WG repeat-containing protein [bacterium]
MKKLIYVITLLLLSVNIGYCSNEDLLVGVCNDKNQCGAVNLKGEVKIPFLYSWLQFNPAAGNNIFIAAKPKNGHFDMNLDNDKYGIIDKTGKVLVDFKYDYIFDDEKKSGLYQVKIGDNTGYIDIKGNVAVPVKFKRIGMFSENLAPATINNLDWGYINKKGETVIPFKYTKASPFKNGYAVVCKDDKCGVIDKTGKVVVDIKYEHVNNELTMGLFAVKSNGKYGFVDTNGKTVVPFKYWSINAYNLFSNGLAAVAISPNHWGFIDNNGKTVIPLKYSDVRYFENGYASVKKDKNWIKIDKSGNEISLQDEPLSQELKNQLKLYDSYNLRDNVYYVEKANKSGILDKNGKVIVPAEFNSVYSPMYGVFKATYSSSDKYAFFGVNGKKLLNVKSAYADVIDSDLIHLSIMRKKPVSNAYMIYDLDEGAVDMNGNTIVPNIYDRLEYYRNDGNGVFIVTKNGKISLLDKKGKTIIPFGKYDAICTHNGVFSKDY